jgi:dUTP pyrophosphatase
MHESDAAYDLYADESKLLAAGEIAAINTGISVHMPPSLCAFVLSRSGLALKSGIVVLNAPGLIDSGYRGEIMVILHNTRQVAYSVVSGDRIAQLMFVNVEPTNLSKTFETLEDSDRGTNGLGSTGVSYLGEDDDFPVAPA